MVNSSKTLMLELISNKTETLPTYVLYKDTFGKYKIDINPIKIEKIEEMKNTMLCLENYTKPLKSVSAYKVEDLEILAQRLGVYDENRKYKKADLYEEVTNKCKWI